MTSIQSVMIIGTVVLGGLSVYASLGASFLATIEGETQAVQPSNSAVTTGHDIGGRSLAGSGSDATQSSEPNARTALLGAGSQGASSHGASSNSAARSRGPSAMPTAPSSLFLASLGRTSSEPSATSASADTVSASANPDTFPTFFLEARSLLGENEGSSFAYGAQTAASSREYAGSTDNAAASEQHFDLSEQELAERRGELYGQIQDHLVLLAAIYGNDDLDELERDEQLALVRDALAELRAQDERLEDEQADRDLLGADAGIFSVLGILFSDDSDSQAYTTLHERRFADREQLAELRAQRAELVAQIRALRESGAAVAEYQRLQEQLQGLDRDVESILARDAQRFEHQIELGIDVILPTLEMALESVGPAVGNAEAVRKFLEAPVSVTADDLVAVMPNLPREKAQEYAPLLHQAMEEAEINTPQRQAAFLAQLAHESIGLTAFEEYASGAAYEWRTDLGNVHAGDGRRYKGRGPIQLTGRANYRSAGAALGIDLEGNPTRAADPDVGFRIAAWYWETRGLNELADAGDFEAITYRINGGYNGASHRREMWARAKSVLY